MHRYCLGQALKDPRLKVCSINIVHSILSFAVCGNVSRPQCLSDWIFQYGGLFYRFWCLPVWLISGTDRVDVSSSAECLFSDLFVISSLSVWDAEVLVCCRKTIYLGQSKQMLLAVDAVLSVCHCKDAGQRVTPRPGMLDTGVVGHHALIKTNHPELCTEYSPV